MPRAKKENSEPVIGGNAGAVLLGYVERIERLEEDKKNLAEDIKEIFVEVKSAGFDVKVLRAVIKRRKQDQKDLEEFEALLDTYMNALSMKKALE